MSQLLGCPSGVGRQEKDGSLRVCSDYKMTLNKCADVDQYLPDTEDLFATLAGGQKTKVARLIYLTRISRLSWVKIYRSASVTIITHKGLYRYKRLSFEV